MNSKLRQKVGDLIKNIELVIKKNEMLDKKQNKRQVMTGAVPKYEVAGEMMEIAADPELKS